MAGAMGLCGPSRRSAFVVVAGALLGACSAGAPGPAAPVESSSGPAAAGGPVVVASTPAGPVDLGAVDETDPDAVADAVAVAVSAHDARTDADAAAAWGRASRWMGGALASAPAGGAPLADGRWSAMVARGAWDEVEAVDRSIDDPVADAASSARRARSVTVRARDASGWRGLVRTTRLWLELSCQDDGRWRVVGLRASID